MFKKKQKKERWPDTVKSTSPETENHDKNGYVFQDNNKNFIMTNVDINSDTKYTNTNDMNKHDARDLHKWALQRTVSLRSSCWSRVTPHWLKSSLSLSSSRHVSHVSSSLILFDLPFYFHLYFSVLFLSSFLMHSDLHTDLDNLDSVENNLRHSAKGSNDAYDVTFSLTGYEPNDTVSNELIDSQGPFSYVTPSSDQDMDDTTLGKLLAEVHREYADYRSPEGVFVSQSSLSVTSDRTGKPVEKSNIDQFSFGVRNTYSAHNQFPAITQAERMVDRRGKPVGESSSSAQIRTLYNEQRQMIIAECCEKVSHHELQAARAEQERQILQEELWLQQKDFREVHQQDLTEMEELRKFQSSTFDTLARQKPIEDQNTIMELSWRLQELQNEVNCMNDSKDFQDAESVLSGNSHVTNQPGLFPKHPIPEGM